MPICSYVVFPHPGKIDALATTLDQIPGCEALPSSNRDLLLLTTETSTAAEEQALQDQLQTVSDIQCMVLSFGDIGPDGQMGGPGAFGKSKRFP